MKNIKNKVVKYSILDYIHNYYTYYKDELSEDVEVEDVNKPIICHNYLNMLNIIIMKLAANDHDEFVKKMLRFEDKHLYGLEGVKKLIDLYRHHYSCQSDEPAINCSDSSQTLSLLSPLGKCHTFLSSNYFKQVNVKKYKNCSKCIHKFR